MSLYISLNPAEKFQLAQQAKVLLESEVTGFIFNDLDERILNQLKLQSSETDVLLATLRSLTTFKTQLESWANQYETRKQEVELEQGDSYE